MCQNSNVTPTMYYRYSNRQVRYREKYLGSSGNYMCPYSNVILRETTGVRRLTLPLLCIVGAVTDRCATGSGTSDLRITTDDRLLGLSLL